MNHENQDAQTSKAVSLLEKSTMLHDDEDEFNSSMKLTETLIHFQVDGTRQITPCPPSTA